MSANLKGFRFDGALLMLARLRGFFEEPLRLPRRFVTLWSKSLKPI